MYKLTYTGEEYPLFIKNMIESESYKNERIVKHSARKYNHHKSRKIGHRSETMRAGYNTTRPR